MFNSLTIYQCTQPARAVAERIETHLHKREHAPISPLESEKRGFVPPIPGAGLVYRVGELVLFCLRTDVKTVPASAVRERVEQLRQAVEANGDRWTSKRAGEARDSVRDEFLPGIPPATTNTLAFLDEKRGLFFIGASEHAADTFMSVLKNAIGGTPFVTLGLESVDPCHKFTAWAHDPAPVIARDLEVGEMASLSHVGEAGTVNLKDERITDPAWLQLIDDGRQVTSIALVSDSISARVTADLGLRNITPSEKTKADAYDFTSGETTPQAEFIAEAGAILHLVDDLAELLGGFPVQEMIDFKFED